MSKRFWLVMICAGMLTLSVGCEEEKVVKTLDGVRHIMVAVDDSITPAEVDLITDAFEEATGEKLSVDVIEKGEKLSDTSTNVLKTMGVTVTGLAPLAGPYAPLTTAAGQLLIAFGAIGGGVGAWFRRQRNKTAKAAVEAANEVLKGGTALTKTAKANGVSDLVHASYKAVSLEEATKKVAEAAPLK